MGMNDMIQFIRQMSGKLGSNIYAGVQGNNPQHISFLRQLQKEMKDKSQLDVRLDQLEVVVFDLETTGFFPDKGDRVISVGAVKMVGEHVREDETFYSLVKSNGPVSQEVSLLTGITNEQLNEAPSASDVLIQFFKFVKSRVLVAHHAKHETAFMQRITWDLMRTRFEHRVVDTSFLIRLSQPDYKGAALEEICTQCGIEVKERHHALADAKMTAHLWSFFIKKAKTQGFNNLREVYEHIAKLR